VSLRDEFKNKCESRNYRNPLRVAKAQKTATFRRINHRSGGAASPITPEKIYHLNFCIAFAFAKRFLIKLFGACQKVCVFASLHKQRSARRIGDKPPLRDGMDNG